MKTSKDIMRGKIIAVDIDGTLTDSICFNISDIRKSKPIKDMIDLMKKLYLENFIVIYTARREHLIEETIRWLNINEIPFHAISLKKIWCNILIDDNSFTPEQIIKEQKYGFIRPRHKKVNRK